MTRAILVLILSLTGVVVAADTDVRLVLKDGSIVRGILVGNDAQSLTLEGKNGKAREIRKVKIRKIFDAATGNPLSLDAISGHTVAPLPTVASRAELTGDGKSEILGIWEETGPRKATFRITKTKFYFQLPPVNDDTYLWKEYRIVNFDKEKRTLLLELRNDYVKPGVRLNAFKKRNEGTWDIRDEFEFNSDFTEMKLIKAGAPDDWKKIKEFEVPLVFVRNTAAGTPEDLDPNSISIANSSGWHSHTVSAEDLAKREILGTK